MDLTLDNANRINDTFYWDVSFSTYKIESITVITNDPRFRAYYNYNVETGACVEQYLESGRLDDTCPAIFSGNFNVFFKLGYESIKEIQSIEIKILNLG